MVGWSTLFQAVQTGAKVIDDDSRKKILNYLKRLSKRKRRIVVFGVSGTGKTQFVNSLDEEYLSRIPARTTTTDTKHKAYEGFPVSFFDTPGHKEFNGERRRELEKIIISGVEGIINVTSYGYQENPERQPINLFTADKQVKQSILQKNREAEIAQLNEWLGSFKPGQVKWIINLVNKSDLWWDDKEDVQRYYEVGDFGKKFKEYCATTQIREITIPYCSIIKSYYNTTRSITFGDIEKEQMRLNFNHQLLNLLGG